MSRKHIPHIRRPWPLPIMCMLRMDCDCGWRGEVPEGKDAKEELDRLFVEHIPEGKRQTYVLVEQRVGFDPGNWIMPEGKPCRIKSWRESGSGFFYATVIGFDIGDHEFEMKVGEIRLADGRVFAFE